MGFVVDGVIGVLSVIQIDDAQLQQLNIRDVNVPMRRNSHTFSLTVYMSSHCCCCSCFLSFDLACLWA